MLSKHREQQQLREQEEETNRKQEQTQLETSAEERFSTRSEKAEAASLFSEGTLREELETKKEPKTPPETEKKTQIHLAENSVLVHKFRTPTGWK